MAYLETDIIREGMSHTIIRKGKGRFELLKHGATHATVCGWFTFPNDSAKALAYANREFDKREGLSNAV